MTRRRFAAFAWAALVYTVGVILWGAFVRATGSGAGCGAHWPLCNGRILPRPERLETLIELTHRATSGLALLLLVVLAVWAVRLYPRRHRVRVAALISLALMLVEALIGAGLVLFEMVADNDSVARALWMSAHLGNTLLLLGAMAAAAWWASGGPPVRLRGQGTVAWLLGVGLGGMLVLGMSGAVTALGDTLFPAATLGEGLRQDLSPTAHVLIRLRIFHPLIALSVGLYLILAAGYLRTRRAQHTTRRLARLLVVLYLVQIGAGFLNVALLAPVWLQLVHLLFADAIWVTLVLLTLSALRAQGTPVADGIPDRQLAAAQPAG